MGTTLYVHTISHRKLLVMASTWTAATQAAREQQRLQEEATVRLRGHGVQLARE